MQLVNKKMARMRRGGIMMEIRIFLAFICAVVVIALAIVSVYSATVPGYSPPVWAILAAIAVGTAGAIAVVFGRWWALAAVVVGGVFLWRIATDTGGRRSKVAVGAAIAAAVCCLLAATAGWFLKRPEAVVAEAVEYVPAGTYPASDFAPPEGGDSNTLYYRGSPVEVFPDGLLVDGDEVVVANKGLRYK